MHMRIMSEQLDSTLSEEAPTSRPCAAVASAAPGGPTATAASTSKWLPQAYRKPDGGLAVFGKPPASTAYKDYNGLTDNMPTTPIKRMAENVKSLLTFLARMLDKQLSFVGSVPPDVSRPQILSGAGSGLWRRHTWKQ